MKINNLHNPYLPLLFVSITILFVSCKKLVQVDPPINESTAIQVFNSESSANGAINGLYATLVQTFDNNALLFPALSADELKDNGNMSPGFYTNSLKADNVDNSVQWQAFYNLIYQSNAIIEGVQGSNVLSTELKNQLLGEAKFIRAFMHFELTSFYGDVPIITTTDAKINFLQARKSQDLVYQKIIADLIEAQYLLNDNYGSADRARINRSAATALLARVYLYHKDYNDAEKQATKLIENTSLFQLSTLSSTFIKTSKETIFQIANSNGYTRLGSLIVPSSSATKANYSYIDNFKSAIETNDKRRSFWMNTLTFNGNVYLYPYKYKNTPNTANTLSEYIVVLRLAEQYLIRAEARAEENNLNGAKDDLNLIRYRAGLDKNVQNTKAEILNAIERERRIELSAEFGHRWFDLKRTGHIDQVMTIVKQSWRSALALYPIPFSDLLSDPNLTQNPEY